jgi:hypothetical protein
MVPASLLSMKILRLTLLILLIDSVAGVCPARLGDTEAACITRYGAEFDTLDNLGFDVIGDKAASFHLKTPHGAFVLSVTFYNGVAAMEKITPADSSALIGKDEVKTILDSEAAGQTWKAQGAHYRTDRSDMTAGSEGWLRSDGATAICWMSGKPTSQEGWGEIDISSRQYAAAQEELDRRNGAR